LRPWFQRACLVDLEATLISCWSRQLAEVGRCQEREFIVAFILSIRCNELVQSLGIFYAIVARCHVALVNYLEHLRRIGNTDELQSCLFDSRQRHYLHEEIAKESTQSLITVVNSDLRIGQAAMAAQHFEQAGMLFTPHHEALEASSKLSAWQLQLESRYGLALSGLCMADTLIVCLEHFMQQIQQQSTNLAEFDKFVADLQVAPERLLIYKSNAAAKFENWPVLEEMYASTFVYSKLYFFKHRCHACINANMFSHAHEHRRSCI
jgi:hypothetical protein